MKKAFLLLALLLAPAVVWAQVSSPPSVRYVVSPPSGACAFSPPIQIVRSTGDTWGCVSGTWTRIGNGGGGGATTPATSNALFGNGSANSVRAGTPGGDYVQPFGSAQNQFIQQQVTNANYTTLQINSLNDEIWVEGFTGGSYTGIGQAQVAWVTATNYALCQNVSSGGNNYVAVTRPNTSITPGSNAAIWWPKATADATTQADCAFATAAAQAQQQGKGTILRAGSGTWNMTGWIEPAGLYAVSVLGSSSLNTNWNYTGTAAVPMLQRASGGAFAFMTVAHAQWIPNRIASAVFDLGALNQSEFFDMQWAEPAPGSTFFTRFGLTGGDGFQLHVHDITFGTNTGQASHLANRAVLTANLGSGGTAGQIVSYTVTDGGSGIISDALRIPYLQLSGYRGGTSNQPCDTMPTNQPTFTISGGVITAVTPVGSGAALGVNCSGTIDAVVYTYYPVQWGIYNNASDSRFQNITMYAGSPAGAGIYNNGGDTNFDGIHPSFIANGINTLCDGNSFHGTELDNILNQGFQFLQPFAHPGCSVVGTHAYGTVPGSTPYYFGSANSRVSISSSASLCETAPPADWHEFVTQSGTIDVAADYLTRSPVDLRVVGNDTSCGQVMGDYIPVLTAGSLSGGVSSVSNGDGTLAISPTTGATVASLNLGHANNWTNTQTFSNGNAINASGVISITAGQPLELRNSGGSRTRILSDPSNTTFTGWDFTDTVNSVSPFKVSSVVGNGALGPMAVGTGACYMWTTGLAAAATAFMCNPSSNTYSLGSTAGVSDGALTLATVNGIAPSSLAPLASPALTGLPTAPTATGGTNTTQIATTAFVQAALPAVPVTSVFTRTGPVVAVSGDYTAAQITNAAATNAANTFTAAQTNSTAGAASAASSIMSGAPYTAGTGTTNHPLFYFNTAGASAPTDWSLGGTFLGVNAASGSIADFLRFHVNGAAAVFIVATDGTVTSLASSVVGSNNGFVWTSKSKMLSPSDGVIRFTNNASSGFTRLDFGGTTSSFPGLQVNGASLQAELADGSAQTSFGATSFLPSAAQTTVSCSTSGSAVFSQPLAGSSDKKVLIHLAACLGTASYTYPTAFTNTPSVYASNNVAASIASTVSTTAVTVTGATTTGSLVLEDY